ncbi:hypothetical protein ACFFRR_005275 [Megaselia abdita]
MAANFDASTLFLEQDTLSKEITTLYNNYKKAPLDRRAKLEFVNSRIQSICELFQKMAENHKNLSTLENKSLKYIKDKFFEKFTTYHEQSLAVLIEDKAKLKKRIPLVDVSILPESVVAAQQDNPDMLPPQGQETVRPTQQKEPLLQKKTICVSNSATRTFAANNATSKRVAIA